MEHLSRERLARWVDEAPEADDARHLEACAACLAELEALRAQTAALGELAELRPPRGGWDHLEARMVSEGLVRAPSKFDAIGRTPGWMRVAAAVVLFVGGTGLGLAVAEGPGPAGSGGRGGATPFALASGAGTLEEAAEVVRLAERQYMDALLRYRQLLDVENGAEPLGDPEGRYAALEYVVAATQAAMQQAPADPFLNGLLASALAERQAVRQQAVRQAGAPEWY